MDKFLGLLVLLLIYSLAMAQGNEYYIHGTISLKSGEQIMAGEGSLIGVYQNNAMSRYVYSDSQGNFRLSCVLTESSVISVYHFGYVKKNFSSKDLVREKDGYRLNCLLEEDVQFLDAIVVKPQNIEQDTINIKMDILKLSDHDNLSMLLSRSANFMVDNDGNITYKGKPIHRILVDGDEFFYHQNTIALEKVESRMIEGIQVINNYSDRFSASGGQSKETVLNLKSNKKMTALSTGSVSLGGGINSKFDGQVLAMRFAKMNRGFLANSSNNTGRSTMNAKDLVNLFSEAPPVSYIQTRLLNELFVRENREKDLSSTTNISYINQSEHNRLQLLIYYLYRDRQNSTSTILQDPMADLSFTNRRDEASKNNSVFITVKDDFVPGKNQLLNYTFNTIFMKPYTVAGSWASTLNTVDSTTFRSSGNDFSFYNQLQYTVELATGFQLSTNIDCYQEKSDISEVLFPRRELIFNTQGYKKNFFGARLSMSYIVLPFLTVRIELLPNCFDERLQEYYYDSSVNRHCFFEKYLFAVAGQNIWDRLDYDIHIGFSSYKLLSESDTVRQKSKPISCKLSYENGLSRFSLSYVQDSRLQPICESTTTIDNNRIYLGNPIYLSSVEEFAKASGGYYYNSFVSGKSLSLSASYDRSFGGNQFSLTNYSNGIEYYDVFDVLRKEESTVDLSGGILVMKRSRCPFKAQLSSKVSFVNCEFVNSFEELRCQSSRTVSSKLSLKSLSKQVLNFEINARHSWSSNKIDENVFDSQLFETSSTLLFQNARINGSIAYVFNVNNVFHQKYTRNNIDFSLTFKTRGKLHFSLEGKNVDQFFGIFNNQSYAIRTRVVDGVHQTTFYTQALHYLLFRIKYIF